MPGDIQLAYVHRAHTSSAQVSLKSPPNNRVSFILILPRREGQGEHLVSALIILQLALASPQNGQNNSAVIRIMHPRLTECNIPK